MRWGDSSFEQEQIYSLVKDQKNSTLTFLDKSSSDMNEATWMPGNLVRDTE